MRVGLLFHEGEGKGCGKGYGQPYEYGYGKGGKSFPAPAKGKGKGIQAEAAKGKGKGGKSKGVSSHGEAKGGKKGQRRPTTAQAWLEAISVEADPDRKVEMMASSALVLAAGLQELPLASLRTLTDTINDCQGGLIPQRLDTALQQLAPALVPCLMRKLAPQLSAERLDVMLKVLQRTLQAEPTMGAVLQNRNNMSPVQAAVQQNGSLFTRQLWEQLQAIADQGANAPLRSVVHSRAREQARTANARDLPDPFEVDILPTFEELLRTDGRLPTNRDGSWDADSEEQLYRQTHFLLYKEELLAPLREAVASFLSQKAGHSLTERLTGLLSRLVSSAKSAKPVNSTFYPNTRAVDFAVSSNKKPMLQLQFETGGRRIDFTLGSHLIHGSLVILFETNSQQAPIPDSAMYAVVEEFDLRQATHRNVVGVSFLDPDDLGRFSISKKYVMVESPAYFHAVRPVLEWLQNPDRLHSMQLKHDLLSGVRRERVEFLRGVQVDISCLYKRELTPKDSWKSRDPLQPWPDPQDIELDPSQQQAMKHILRSSVPLVQGPPGTGKSYIGVKAVQILRQALDKKGYKEPIVLVCLTNHALDQFLEDLLDLFPDRLIRFGGRTKSEDVRLLRCMVHHHMRGSKDDFIDRKTHEEKLESKVQSLQSLLRSVATLKGQVRLLITGLSINGMVHLLEAIGAQELEYGMFYQPDRTRRTSPARNFILWVLHSWAEGWSLQETQGEVQVPRHRTSEQEVEIHNRFDVLGEDVQTADWTRPLDDVDRLIGRNPAMVISGSWWGQSDSEAEEEDDDLDDEEVEAVLDDRIEQGTSQRQSSHRAQAATMSTDAEAALAAWGSAYDRAEAFERRVQECQRGLEQVEEDVEEEAEEGQWTEAQTNREKKRRSDPFKRQLKQLKAESPQIRSRWQRAKQDARRAQIRGVHKDIRAGLETLLGKACVRDLKQELPERTTWNQAAKRRSETLKALVGVAAEAASSVFQEGFQEAQTIGTHLGQLKKRAQLQACKEAAVVGMTSTFAALNADLLRRMGSRVVVVEEAGELLECQLMACLSSENLQQVVLIGDHQQLRPKVNTYDLCRKHKFDLSLFERLVVSGCDRAKLVTQLRMHPDVSDLVRPFYDRIEDHARVMNYPMIPGVADRLYWLSHSKEEDSWGQTQMLSKVNSHEAKLAVRLAQHLVYNGIDKGRITLLTPYLGQKREIKKLLPRELMSSYVSAGGDVQEQQPKGKGKKGKDKGKDKGKGKGKGKGKEGKGKADGSSRMIPGVRIVTIDDYQGEENDVIILSLVRCNPKNILGFCSIENRLIVALSRARHGMYILGEHSNFEKDDKWFKVISKLENRDRIGSSLNLRCAKHPRDDGMVKTAEDFDRKALHGGCQRDCDTLLPRCGHRCHLKCHPFDPEHKDVVCNNFCSRPRPPGCTHDCKRLCKNCPGERPEDLCPSKCQEWVEAVLPCGHSQREHCHQVQTPELRAEVLCRTEVEVTLPCGHRLKTTCASSRDPANLTCTYQRRVQAACGHMVAQKCNTVQPCRRLCEHVGACGHVCARPCADAHSHDECKHPCKDLLLCGHVCQAGCSKPHTVFCETPCTRRCTHGHQCPKKCHEACIHCYEPCSWKCMHHACTKLCHEMCDRPRCDEPCKKLLACGHFCRGLCGEPCPSCVECGPHRDEGCPLSLEKLVKAGKLYQLDCGHIFSLKLLDVYMDQHGRQQEAGDAARAIKAVCCPTCQQPVYAAPRYNFQIKGQLQLVDAVKKQLARHHQQLTQEERRSIDRAMGGRHGTGAGHWFACPNGHAYYIGDCGGAMEESTCPECGATVGGGQHRLRPDNAFVANFAGDGEALRHSGDTVPKCL